MARGVYAKMLKTDAPVWDDLRVYLGVNAVVRMKWKIPLMTSVRVGRSVTSSPVVPPFSLKAIRSAEISHRTRGVFLSGVAVFDTLGISV